MDQSDTAEDAGQRLNASDVLRECLICGLVAVDARGDVCAFNAEAERLTQLEPGTILGQPLARLPQPLRELIAETLERQHALANRELAWNGPGDARLLLRASSAICQSNGGVLTGVVVCLSDLTAVQNLGSNMQRLDRLATIGTLSASMAHEIKNALVAINTFVGDLLERNRDSELASLVARELHRIDSIVSQMLKFSGPARPAFSRLSVHRILDQSLRLVLPQLLTKQIQLVRSLTADPDLIQGDDYQLEQAFLNILLNALAALEPAGQLRVSTTTTNLPDDSDPSATAPWLEVNVTDTGTGIPPEHLSRIFEPFFTTNPNGTGLGLAITRRIILEHRGKITVESEARKGSRVRIMLPLAV